MKNTKKGITPIVAIILLLLMTVAAAGIAYTWLQSMQSGTQQSVSGGITDIQQQASTKLDIISVAKSGNYFQITIKNSGQNVFPAVNTTNTQIMIDGTSSTFSGCASDINPGATCAITTSTGSQFPTTAGVTREIKIFLSNGLTLNYKCVSKYSGTQLVC